MRLFGTDGIRGRANVWPMTPEVALKVGMAVGYILSANKNSKRGIVVVGKDTRISGYVFEYAISSGLCAVGTDVYLLGPMPTPAISFITRDMKADAGIVISASHNPYYDNGIKVFNEDGLKLTDSLEAEIERIVLENTIKPDPERIGRIRRVVDAIGRYIVYLKSTFPYSLSLEKVKIVLDCANGSTYKVAPIVFEELGGSVYPFGVNPNGYNINDGCGSTYPEFARSRLIELGADVAFSFDGDGDRCIAVDDKGVILDGDDIVTIISIYLKSKGLLEGNRVVSTIMAGMGLEIALRNYGIELVRANVGDRYVFERMKEVGANIGGEPSGHIILLDHTTTGDGIITALKLLTIMVDMDMSLSDLRKKWVLRFPKEERSVPVKNKIPIESTPLFQVLRKLENEIKFYNGRILVRYSGTEPKIRILVEGEDETKVKDIADVLEEGAKKYLGGCDG
ncbi:MAG: phosphoglucosamine mutase [Thermosulfidibacteraceae bacterium]|jgi:phosphoglucosamine mutase